MTTTLRSVAELEAAGLVSVADAEALGRVAARYAIALTPAVADLIDRADPDDPIARQFVPDARELDTRPEELADPIGDARFTRAPGVVHRYPDRVLLKLTHVCPVYCRFCFRREMVGPGGPQALSGEALEAALAYIAGDSRIWEVILTGGDPLMLSPRRVAEVTTRLSAIPAVRILRWHSRVPIVDPDRVTEGLAAALKSSAKAVYLAVHANHPREINPAVRAALARLRDSGITLLSQTVLLKGINDDADTLAELMRALVEARVKPYYLHHADLAPGTSHFRTSVAAGREIMRRLRSTLSGIAQPTYVLDIPGGHAKVPIGPDYVSRDGGTVLDPAGVPHDYPDRG